MDGELVGLLGNAVVDLPVDAAVRVLGPHPDTSADITDRELPLWPQKAKADVLQLWRHGGQLTDRCDNIGHSWELTERCYVTSHSWLTAFIFVMRNRRQGWRTIRWLTEMINDFDMIWLIDHHKLWFASFDNTAEQLEMTGLKSNSKFTLCNYHCNMNIIFSDADPGFLSWIPDSNFFHPGSRIQGKKIPGSRIWILIKEFKYFNPTNCFSDLGNMIRDVHPGSGSRIRILICTRSGFRIQGSKGTGSWIRNTDHHNVTRRHS